jgi:phage terminase small subunit
LYLKRGVAIHLFSFTEKTRFMGKRKSDVGNLKLTEKQERFCTEYIKDLNATRAGKAAGYKGVGIAAQMSKLLTQVNIIQRISQLREKAAEKATTSAAEVIAELVALGFWNVNDFVNPDNTIKKLHDIDRSKTKAVVGIKVTERTFGSAESPIKEVSTELKLVDKKSALVDLGRHLGIFEKDNRQKAQEAISQFMTLSEALKDKK